jgi:hypothetical protein
MPCPDSGPSSNAIAAALGGPQSVTSDAGSVTQYGLGDLIAADKYLASRCAATSKRRGLRYTRLIPDGTVQAAGPPRGFGNVDRWYGY